MELRRREETSMEEPRYDPETAGKVAALAARLQSRHQETLTAGEIEAIGAEVGLKPSFIQQALLHLNRQRVTVAERARSLPPTTMRSIASAWWAAGWAIPLMFFVLSMELFHSFSAIFFLFLGLATYIGGGVFLSSLAESETVKSSEKLPRTQLLEMLFALQEQLEGQKQHRAFLSADVVDSSEMKRQASDLAVEYSFGKFHQWVQEIIRAEGGETQSTAGDGVMCVFPTNRAAVRAARRLQEGLGTFNSARNRLGTPFRLRCGVSAGELAIEDGTPLGHLQSRVIDRAAALQKQAEPGDILVGEELADVALIELGTLSRLPNPVAGGAAFSWRTARHALPEQG